MLIETHETNIPFDTDDVRLAFSSTDLFHTAIDMLPKSCKLTRFSRVLEMGCGSGKFGVHLALRFKCDVVLSDIDSGRLINASKLRNIAEIIVNYPLSVSIMRDDARQLGWEDGSFDLVLNEGTVEHPDKLSPDRQKLISEMARVAKKAVLIMTNDADDPRVMERAEETKQEYPTMPEKETPYYQSELAENMEKAGLKDVIVRKYKDPVIQYGYLIGVGTVSP